MSSEETGKEPVIAETTATETSAQPTEGEPSEAKQEPTPAAADADAEAKPEEEKAAEENKEAEKIPKKPKRKETKKRVRRVGKTEPRKFLKVQSTSTPADDAPPEGEADAPRPEGTTIQNRRVLSKHDEKWNAMFDKLVAYKKANEHTLVPQCYHEDPRLGRWVHYQRVEYWIFQQCGTGKITPERIGRLEGMGFEWDPQKAQWNMLFDKLVKFKEEVGHCKVPKGYSKDTELANWVRNQRLEQANMKKGKKSRMTQERFQQLDDLGFKWSTSIAKKGTSRKPVAASAKPEEKPVEDEAAKMDAPPPETETTPPEKQEDQKPAEADTQVVQI